MSGLTDQWQEFADALRANGVRAVTDPRRVTPPCVVVVPESAEFSLMGPGNGNTEWVFQCIAAPPGNSDAVTQLSDLAAQVIETVPDVQTARLASFAVDNGDPMPCIELRLTAVTSWA